LKKAEGTLGGKGNNDFAFDQILRLTRKVKGLESESPP